MALDRVPLAGLGGGRRQGGEGETKAAPATETMVRESFTGVSLRVRIRVLPGCSERRGGRSRTGHGPLTGTAGTGAHATPCRGGSRPTRGGLSWRPARAHARATHPAGSRDEVTDPTRPPRGCRPRTQGPQGARRAGRKPGTFSSVTGRPTGGPQVAGSQSRTSPSVPRLATRSPACRTSITNPADTSRGGATGSSVRPSRNSSRPSSPPTTRSPDAHPSAVARRAVSDRLGSRGREGPARSRSRHQPGPGGAPSRATAAVDPSGLTRVTPSMGRGGRPRAPGAARRHGHCSGPPPRPRPIR